MKCSLALASIVGFCLASGAAAQSLTPPVLGASENFPALGSSITFTLSGQPGASWVLDGALAPAEKHTRFGTLFLSASAGFLRLASGALDPAGNASVAFTVPNDVAFVGLFVYVQAAESVLPARALSNAIPFQVQAAPPSGSHTPLSIAATPDGSKLYVAHENGSLSVIAAATGTRIASLPVGPDAEDIPFHAVDVSVGPDGEHAFVTNAAAEYLTVIDTATNSVAAKVPVPKGCRRVAFDFGATKTVYVTNDRDDDVLRLREGPPGTFTALAPLVLLGRGPGAIAVLPGGRIMVGDRATHEVEVLDPSLPPASATVARTALASIPNDIQVAANAVLVAGFTSPPDTNKVFELDPASFAVTGTLFANVGTDYLDLVLAPPYLAVVAAGSGTALIADATTDALLATIDLAPGSPVGTPQHAAFATAGAGGAPVQLWTVDYFRESARCVQLSGGPPFALGNEVALAYSGAPRVPLVDLTQEENGDWFFRSVQFFNGSATNPNPVTCATCHPDAASDGLTHGREPPVFYAAGQTAPYGWTGNGNSLPTLISGAFSAHGRFGGSPPAGSVQMMADFIGAVEGPPSPFLAADGSLSASAQSGKLVFEGQANCVRCHAAPDFIPLAPNPLTINGGVGTGLVPANVPTLLGVWSSAPYLHDGSAMTLLDVLDHNVNDRHGTTSTLTAQQKADLVAYLRSL